jgi:hypothetical protein
MESERSLEALPEEAPRDSSKPLDRMEFVLRWSGIEQDAIGTSTSTKRSVRVISSRSRSASRQDLPARHIVASHSDEASKPGHPCEHLIARPHPDRGPTRAPPRSADQDPSHSA